MLNSNEEQKTTSVRSIAHLNESKIWEIDVQA